MNHRTTLRFLLEGLEGVAILPLVVVTWPLSRHWLLDWGSRPDERERRWPGDDLIRNPVRATTRAIAIAAPARRVWSYLVQLGLDRAGFYSYELLERLGGIPVTNVESVEPEWQTLAVGDEVLLHPSAGVRLAAKDEGRSLRFGKRTFRGEDIADASWSFYLESESAQSCRLIVRSCFGPPDRVGFSKRLATGLEAALDAVMERRMLRTLRRLGETGTPGKPGDRHGASE